MKKIFLSVVGLFSLIVLVSSCDLFRGVQNLITGSTLGFPASIGIDVPSTLDSTRSPGETTNAGEAYLLVQELVAYGTDALNFIDTQLTTIQQNASIIFATQGQYVAVDSQGFWFFFDDQNDGTGYYMYFGQLEESVPVTNFYLDWETDASSNARGNCYYWYEGDPEFVSAYGHYDQTVSEPYVDLYAEMNPTNEFDGFRLKLVDASDGGVDVFSKIDYTSGNEAFGWVEGWDVVAYAIEGGNGGAIGYTHGMTNSTETNAELYEVSFSGSNYEYSEYFNSTGETIFSLAEFEYELEYISTTNSGDFGFVNLMTGLPNDAATNDSDPYNDYGVGLDMEMSFTNGDPKPAALSAQVEGMTVLTTTDFPSFTLP